MTKLYSSLWQCLCMAAILLAHPLLSALQEQPAERHDAPYEVGKKFCRPPKQGVTGPTGPTGPTGATGSITSSITVIADAAAANIPIPAGSPTIFDQIFFISGTAISYNTTTGFFTITESGTYEITFGGRWGSISDSTDLDPVVALQIGGVEIPHTQIVASLFFDSFEIGDWISVPFIFPITASESAPKTVAIINSALTVNHIFLFNESPNSESISAFATIKKIN